MKILSFDTGHNLAWSMMNTEVKSIYNTGFTHIESNITLSKFCDLTKKYLYEHFYPHIKYGDKILIECPIFEQSKRGVIAAKTGDLFYILASAITIYNFFQQENKILITPQQWKGKLNKRATKTRIEIIIPNIDKILLIKDCLNNEHILDTIGMSLSQNKRLWNLYD